MRRIAVLALALALDLRFGDQPNRAHPVAWLGKGIGWLMRTLPRGQRADAASGFVLAAIPVALSLLLGRLAVRASRGLPPPASLLLEAVLLKQTIALRGLLVHAERVRLPLASGDIEGARAAVSMMVSRPTADLDEAAAASAAIESLAENASDSVAAPAFWYLCGGLPSAFAYRAANTLDAMAGYHSFGSFGAPSARLDDALNFVPARLTAVLFALASGRAVPTLKGAYRDQGHAASPNAGWPMAAAAHALGLRLEKRGHHVFNMDGAAPGAADIARAAALVRRALLWGDGRFLLGRASLWEGEA